MNPASPPPRDVLSIRSRLLLVGLATAAVTGLLLAVLVVQAFRSERRSAVQGLLNLAEAMSQNVAEVMGTSRRVAASFASNALGVLEDPSTCEAWHGRAPEAFPVITNLLLVDAAGTPVCSHHPGVVGVLDYGDRAWVPRVMAGQPVISEPVIGKLTGVWSVAVIHPVFDGGRTVGAVAVGLELSRFQEFLAALSLPEGAVVTLATDDGIVLARSRSPEVWVGQRLPSPTGPEESLGPSASITTAPSLEGESTVFVNETVSDVGWRVHAGWARDQALASAWAQARQSGVYGLLLTLLIAAGFAWVYLSTTRSLSHLMTGAAEAARRGVPLPAEGPQEIRAVATRINETLSTLGRAEDQVRKMARVASQLADPVFITDFKGVIEYVNPAFEQVTGYTFEEAVGRTPAILNSGEHPEEVYAELWETLTSGRTYRGRIRNRRKSGELYTDEKTISPLRNEEGEITHFVATGRDVTAQEALSVRLQRVEKLEAVGQLAGGVAHDFNNVLTAITGYAELLAVDLRAAGNQEALAHVSEILEGAQMAGSLTHQLLTFSRREVVEAESVSLNAVIGRVTSFLRRVIPADIGVALDLDRETAPVWIDPIHAEQIVLNLALNARDAMSQGGGLTIRTRRIPGGAEAGQDEAREGWTALEVRDTGSGIPPQMKEQVFDPFFTTKSHGTGLGLATVREVVLGAGGAIEVDTEVGVGTTFRVLLPPHETMGGVSEPIPRTAPPQDPGKRMVLLAEDDPQVRALLTRILERAGHKVVVGVNGAAALAAAASLGRRPDLVITDVMMPAMKGPDLVRELRERHPGLPALFITGDAGVSLEEIIATGPTEILPKPVSAGALRDAVERLTRPLAPGAAGAGWPR